MTENEASLLMPIPTIENEISRFYALFTARQVGGIEAEAFPGVLWKLVINKFGSEMYVDRFGVNLAEGVALIMSLNNLRGVIDLDKLEDKGIEEDIIRHLKTIDQLWARLDKALLMLARQNYIYDRHKVTSADGMKILNDAIFAVSLHEFLDNLDLFRDDKFMETIETWREGMESILIAILNSIGWEEEAKDLADSSQSIRAELENRVQTREHRYPFQPWRISTAL